MICALTVRKLRAGSFEQFREAFMQPVRDGDVPGGLKRFTMIRSTSNPDEVVCFGLFDGDADSVRASAASPSYEAQQAAIAPYVESVGADGFFEVVEDMALPSER